MTQSEVSNAPMIPTSAIPGAISTRRPRLLFLAHRLPFPPHNGAAVRTYNILRLLSRDFDIVGLCFDRLDRATASLGVERGLAGLSDFGRFEAFDLSQQRSRRRVAVQPQR